MTAFESLTEKGGRDNFIIQLVPFRSETLLRNFRVALDSLTKALGSALGSQSL